MKQLFYHYYSLTDVDIYNPYNLMYRDFTISAEEPVCLLGAVQQNVPGFCQPHTASPGNFIQLNPGADVLGLQMLQIGETGTCSFTFAPLALVLGTFNPLRPNVTVKFFTPLTYVKQTVFFPTLQTYTDSNQQQQTNALVQVYLSNGNLGAAQPLVTYGPTHGDLEGTRLAMLRDWPVGGFIHDLGALYTAGWAAVFYG